MDAEQIPMDAERSSSNDVEQGLSAGVVARRLGVAVTTLRAWHQRYGLGPSQHRAGHHRRYDPGDLHRLEVMRGLTARGIPAAEAARMALDPAATSGAGRPGTRDGGGNAIKVGRAGAAARGLARAAMRLDSATVRGSVELSLSESGVVCTWDTLLRPVLAGVGNQHAATGRLVEVEHVLSRGISEALATVPRPPAAAPQRILLACVGEEQHSLPLESLSAALAERGVGSRLLGARVPAQALLDAVSRTGPRVVVLWAHAPATADLSLLARLRAAPRPPAMIMAAGPGWPCEVPDLVRVPASLSEAVEMAVSFIG